MQRVAGASQRRRESHFARHFFFFLSLFFFFFFFFWPPHLTESVALSPFSEGSTTPPPYPSSRPPTPPSPSAKKKPQKKKKNQFRLLAFGKSWLTSSLNVNRRVEGRAEFFFFLWRIFFLFFYIFREYRGTGTSSSSWRFPRQFLVSQQKKKKDEDGALGRHSFVLFLCSRCKKNDSSFFSFLFFHRVWQQWPRATAMTHPKIGF